MVDNDNKKEFQYKLKGKLNEEIKKFKMENIGIIKDNFQKNLYSETKEFLNDMNGKNKEKYIKIVIIYFFKIQMNLEKNINKSCPNFEGKNDLLFDKIINLSKKFFENNFTGNKNEIDNQINEYKNEISILNQKLNQANDELIKLKQKNGNINKLNADIINEKMKKKNIKDKINILINEKK